MNRIFFSLHVQYLYMYIYLQNVYRSGLQCDFFFINAYKYSGGHEVMEVMGVDETRMCGRGWGRETKWQNEKEKMLITVFFDAWACSFDAFVRSIIFIFSNRFSFHWLLKTGAHSAYTNSTMCAEAKNKNNNKWWWWQIDEYNFVLYHIFIMYSIIERYYSIANA